MSASTSASCRRSETNPAREMVGRAASTMFSRTDSVGMMPSALRSSGMSAMPAEIAARGDPSLDRLARDLDCAAVERLRAVDGLGGLGPARSEEAGEPDDLAGARLDRHAIQHVASGQAGRSQQRARRPAKPSCDPNRVRARATSASSRPSILETSSSRVICATGPVCTRRPSRSTVTTSHKPEDFVEPVRDVDDRHPVAAEKVDDLHQALDLPGLKRGGGLVHDDDPVIGVDRAGDGDHLLDAKPELPEGAPHVDRDAVARQDSHWLHDASVRSRSARDGSSARGPGRGSGRRSSGAPG